MIQAKELRLGNWIKVYGDVTCAWNLSSDDDVNDEGNGDHIQPIPLTPEILEKCGFEKQDDGDGGYYLELLSANGFLFVAGDKKGYTDVFIDLWEQLRVRYLHQLQNLYFALTGNEINYKP